MPASVKKYVEKNSTAHIFALMAATDPDPILRVLQGLVRPLARMLIARGVTAPAFYRLLKKVYVEVAHDEFRLDDKPPTQSRISLLTGVHRRDVHDILADDGETWEASRRKSAAFATVLGQWLARPDYQDESGTPLPLPRAGGEGPNFEALVRDISRDIRPRTVLDELLRQSLVTEGKDGLFRIAEEAVLGPSSSDHKIVFFASNVGDHLAAAAENLMAEDPPFLERAVFYNRLTEGSVDQIEQKARSLSQTMLEEINRESGARQQADRDTPDNSQRYRFGVYFYREDRARAETDDPEGT